MVTLFVIHFDSTLFFRRIFISDGTFWRAFATTVYIAVIAQVVGTIIGLFSALAGRSRLRVLRLISYCYVLVFRGTPIIVQIFFMYFGANLFLGFDLFPRSLTLGPIQLSGAVLAGMVALAVNEGAFMSEIVRSGISAIDSGQMEAALSVGMPRRLAMRRIVLPQAARVIVPPLGNEFNGMLKTTSLLAFIGVYEMFQDATVQYSTTFKPVELFAAVAVWYLVLTTLWSLIQVQIERRLGASDRLVDEPWTTRLLGIQAAGRGVR